MCGIFFSLGFNNLTDSVIDSVAHRGPDGRGWNEFTSSDGPVILAHRRLAIVDLSADGHQPMPAQNGRYWVTYNGEIYNYLEVREELKKLGHQFKTHSDTEVLLKSYIEWGKDCLHHFNGMFAFVIWDNDEKKFFAARDRFGVKPLYYYQQDNKIAFASEIKQFKQFPNWQSVLDQDAANDYLRLGYCDHQQQTLYKNVFQVLPGYYIESQSASHTLSQWYNLENQIQYPLKLKDEDAIEQFKTLFADAIRLRLRSDVSVGACLSGGLDSSSIVSTISHIQGPNTKIHTFSSIFPGHKVDESHYIKELVSEKKLTAKMNIPKVEEFLAVLDTMLYHQDLPFSGTSIFAQWKTFESAKVSGVTVLLDGQGADESLLGYPGMLNGIIFDYLTKLKFASLYQFINWQSQYNNQSAKNTMLLGLEQRFPDFYIRLLKFAGKNVKQRIINSQSDINGVALFHFYNNLQTLLRYEDRNSMAHSRESRLPFLDYRLVEFILSLPINQRFRQCETKWILRKSMQGININSIIKRKDKIGFATPEQKWWEIIKKSNCNLNNYDNFQHFIFSRWIHNEKF